MFFLRRLFTQYMSYGECQSALANEWITYYPRSQIFPNAGNLESLSWLHEVAPCFPLNGEKIRVINEPKQFYDTLISRIGTAQDRIVLASLYLGTGHLENNFVQALRSSLQRQQKLHVDILLDFTRGTRGEVNSKTMLLPLLTDFKEQIQLSLYHTPVLRGLKKWLMPPRWNELLGLQHMKVYLFDNAVMISGANLSNDYFTNRQDRYILIEDKSLADFYAGFIGRVQEFSLAVQANADVGLHRNWSILPYEGDKLEFVEKAKNSIKEFLQKVCQRQEKVCETVKDADTWIFPLIEMGQIDIHHDSKVTKRFLSSCASGSRLKLATGYFNLTQDYMDTIIRNCPADCTILMAHPNANGFQGARGPAGGIPAAYTLIAKRFYESLVQQKQQHRVNFFEYEKDGWTYHAKGLWYYLPNESLPNLTLIGSSNFGERSVNRDLETQVCIVTANPVLRQQLEDETTHLFQQSKTAELELTTRPIPRWVQAVVRIFRNFF